MAPPRRQELVDFSNYMVAHPRLLEAGDAVKAAIAERFDGEVIVVAGPTGVGKSTLLHKIEHDVELDWATHAGTGSRAIVEILTPSFSAHGFRMVDWYHEVLAALDEPGIGAKVEYPRAGTDFGADARRRRESESAARSACLEALRRRRVEILFCDEAQHMCEAGGSAHVQSLLESVKYVTLATGVLIVLLGTYDLQHLVGLNGQLSRRTTLVHFPRYRADVQSDVDAFVSVLRAFERRMRIPMPQLDEHWQLLYRASNGCVGPLKRRFAVALARALASDREITLSDLMPNAAEQKSLELQHKEIARGEETFSTARWTDPARTDASASLETPVPPRIPFRRSPKRDPVGARGSGAQQG